MPSGTGNDRLGQLVVTGTDAFGAAWWHYFSDLSDTADEGQPMNDELSQTERWLTGELFQLGQQVSSFAVRILGADIEKVGPPNAEEEFQLGSRLVELGTVMVARATQRGSDRTGE